MPYDFARDLRRGTPVDVQFLLNAINANTATIAQGYAEGVIQTYNQTLAAEGIRPSDSHGERRAARPPRRGEHGDRVPLQPGPGDRLVHRHRNVRRAADSERLAGGFDRHGQGARARHRGAVADDARPAPPIS